MTSYPTMTMTSYLKMVDRAADLERGLKAVDTAISEAATSLQSDINSCMRCSRRGNRMPCSACMEGARFLGTLEHLRTKAKVPGEQDNA